MTSREEYDQAVLTGCAMALLAGSDVSEAVKSATGDKYKTIWLKT